MQSFWRYETPIGLLGICEADGQITHILFEHEEDAAGYTSLETPVLREAAAQLAAYFAGTRTAFDLPLSLCGTPFQTSVWTALTQIPFGQTRTYKDIATQIGNEKAPRAVGMANNRNKIPIVIPCHRVIGSNGKLVGYAGGMDTKKALLELEQRISRNA